MCFENEQLKSICARNKIPKEAINMQRANMSLSRFIKDLRTCISCTLRSWLTWYVSVHRWTVFLGLRDIWIHDDVIKWKHFPRYWPFVRGIHRSPVNSPHKGQWRGALMFSLICAGINVWVNNRDAGDLRCHRVHFDVSVMRWIWIHRKV